MLPDIKNYQIIEELGRGGMATVYKAWQPSLSRLVALKVLPPYFAHDEELLLRFRHEARAVAKLRHPHIVQVFDFHQEGDWFYLAMEFVAGGSLQQKLAAAGRLATATALKLAAQVAEGLHHAHDKGFIHRDIKPSNILLTEEEDAVITDFGIVKAIEGTGLTKTVYGGMGTCEYMSPEQSKGEKIGRQSDLYSLGVVLYEALTGSPPFVGESPLAVMHNQIYDEPIKPSLKNPNISAAVEEVVMKLLAKEPARRFASGLELVAALTSVAEGDIGPAAPGDPGKPAFDRPTLVRRDTRVAKAPGDIRRSARLREGPKKPKSQGEKPAAPAAGDSEPITRRLRVGPIVVAAFILLASWTAGFAVSYTYIWSPAGEAAGIKSKARSPAGTRSKTAGPEKTRGDKAETVAAPEPTATRSVSSTSATSEAQAETETPAPNPPLTDAPSPSAPALPPKRYASPPPPSPPPDAAQDIPIVIQ